MSLRRRRSSLRESLSRFLSLRSITRSKAHRLTGRLLFRAAVRLVLEYMEWITEESIGEQITDDVTLNVKAAREKKPDKMMLNLEDRSILLIEPDSRSPMEKAHILNVMKRLRAFKKYSGNLRESLAAVCRYRYFPAGRVIVRQNHQPQNLYFVIKGELSVSRVAIDDFTDEAKEIDMGAMHPGDTFGEIAMLHDIPRTATIVSTTSVDLLLIDRYGFDRVLRDTLTDEWDVLQDALVHFNYFKSWDQRMIRECCVLSRLKEFKPNEVLLGDGKGMINYVHFVLEGECRLIEHMLIREKRTARGTRYKLFDPQDVSESEMPYGSLLKLNGIDVDESRKVTDGSKTVSPKRLDASRDFAGSTKAAEKRSQDAERMSIITTTLLDLVNEWHEITDVAAMLMREPSVTCQKCYPSDVRTVFMQVCMFGRGACFGLGEQMRNRRIVSTTPVRCFLVPRYWLLENNRANIWERVKLFMDSKYPTKEELFKQFVKNRKWMEYKRGLVSNILKECRRVRNTATIHDVPYSIRINEVIDLQ